jgi:dihydroorotate dehydrogenase electron transfer subunit
LSTKKSGNIIDIIAPMGNTFITKAESETEYILAAGGIGLGPMLFLGEYLKARSADMKFIFGCRNRELVPHLQQLNKLNAVICTDDGSSGFRGTVTDYLNHIKVNTFSELFCCGPEPMLKACNDFSETNGIPCRVSMEQIMACSIGACMGCVIKVKSEKGFARVCKEGPVFNSRDVVWT